MNPNLLEMRQQVFFIVSKDGYISKFRARNAIEKRQMYETSLIFLQMGYRALNPIKILFDDGHARIINPASLKYNCRYFLSKKKIITIMEIGNHNE
jgi:hypothetical protein